MQCKREEKAEVREEPMIKKRLVGLLSHAKKYIIYQVVWQWLALICQIVMIYSAAMLLETALFWEVTPLMAACYGGLVLVALILRFVCDRQASHASYRASVDVKRILRDKIYSKLLRLGAAYREKVTTSEVVQMAAEGVEQLETYFGKYLSQLFYSLLAPVTLFVILSFVNWQASLVLLICVPLIPVSIIAVQKIAKKLLNKYWGIYTELGDSFLENLQGLTTLKIYRSDEKKAEEMDEESQRFRQITMKVLTMQLNSTSVMDIIAYGGAAVGMIVTLTQFMKGNLSVHGALMLILLASEFFIPLRLLGSFFHIAMNGMAASDKIFALLDLPEPEEKSEWLDGMAMDIEFTGVHFSYEEDREILKGIDMEFPAGSFTSLVGASGCGKSTAAATLMGRNHGYKGSVTIEGKELADIQENSLMDQITLVSHNSYLFKGTVEDNLRMGRPDASEEEMREALKKVNLWGFLQAQQGIGTPIQERGSNFSGGQCQRLAIARALLHDTPVYIFDEATSNIDAESEEMIMDVIHKLAETKTIILISHRLANVVKSDRIYMMKEGCVTETGTHEELMEQNGDYANLYRSQMELEQYGKEAVS
jgi:ABC-type transport system involved in cytochrome bd biosynthesis fused ATPase/permease subunit